MRKRIAAVKPGSNPWTSPQGSTIHFLSVTFDDGSEGSVGAKPENEEKVRALLVAAVGQEVEVEAKGEHQGVPQFKVLDYPGKPGQAGGSGGGGYRGKSAEERADILAMNALTSAVELVKAGREPDEAKAIILGLLDDLRTYTGTLTAAATSTAAASSPPRSASVAGQGGEAPTGAQGAGGGGAEAALPQSPPGDGSTATPDQWDLAIERFGSRVATVKRYLDLKGIQQAAASDISAADMAAILGAGV